MQRKNCECTLLHNYRSKQYAHCLTGSYMLHLFSVRFPLLLEPLPHRQDQVLVVIAVVEPLLEHQLVCGSCHAHLGRSHPLRPLVQSEQTQ